MMMSLTKWLSGTMAMVLLVGNAAAADTVAVGKVKSINAGNKTFILTDAADKEHTFKLGDALVVNRAGKESKSDLKSGDAINVCYDKGVFTWTAHYILVQEGASKNSELVRGNVKNYDVSKKELTFTNEVKTDSTYPMGDALVRFNMENAKIDGVKIGDHALLIVDMVEGTPTLRSVMFDRAK
jgi:Cu/Ag efflux protein CusF